jgi:predicted DNA-binding protein with PD1-like motif
MMKLSAWTIALLFPIALGAQSATTPPAAVSQDDATISPSRPVPVGRAPGMKWRMMKETGYGDQYVLIFHEGDEALSGLTDFAIEHKVKSAHFTAIGAAQSATLAWLDLSQKTYRKIAVGEQCEVLSLIGDIAVLDGKPATPVVHMHAVLGHSDGSTVGGHVFELNVNPTLEVFMTTDYYPLKKVPDEASGMKLIDPNK